MHRLFGKKVEKPPPPTLTEASTSISTRVEALDKKIKDLDLELLKYKEQLKRAKGPAELSIKKRAMETLKRKKMYEQQRDAMAGQAFNIEQTSFAIDSAKDIQTSVFAMQAAAVTLKAEHKKLDIGKIEDMQDDLQDLFEDMNEITETMGRSYGTPEGLDEDDLEAELACLEDDLEGEIGTSQPSYLQSAAMPSAPSALYPSAPSATVTTGSAAKLDEYGLPLEQLS